MSDPKKRASVRGKGLRIFLGIEDDAPQDEDTQPEVERPIGAVEITPDEVEDLLEVAPEPLGVRDTMETPIIELPDDDTDFAVAGDPQTVISTFQDMVKGILDRGESNAFSSGLSSLGRETLEEIGASVVSEVPDYAQHNHNVSMPYTEETLTDYDDTSDTESEILSDLKQDGEPQVLGNQAIPKFEETLEPEAVDLSLTDLVRKVADELTPDEPETDLNN